MAGYRLDKALAKLFPTYSRSRLQQWIHKGYVTVNTAILQGKDRVQGGEEIQISALLTEEVVWQAQVLPLDLVFEDADILVVNKPAHWVVHPGAGNPQNTLINALLNYAPELAQLPRAGIIHRLDKGTSGLLVVARSFRAYTHLIAQLQARQFTREYQAVVNGNLVSGGCIDVPLGRNPVQRTLRAVIENGKPARTHYRIIQRFRAHTHLRVQLETGRTHQIRVHFAHLRHPLLGDTVYGGHLLTPAHSTPEFITTLRTFQRPALHAEHLGLTHPVTGQWMDWRTPVPEDLQSLLETLQQDKENYA